VDDTDLTAMTRQAARSDRLSPWAGDQLAGPDTDTGPAADAAAGLASLSFIIEAIWRRKRLWCVAAALGLVLGVGLYLERPPPYQATAMALLTLGPNEDPNTAMDTDVALAQSRPVAAMALQKLGLRESVSAFLGSYAATPVTGRVILITTSARSSDAAIRAANEVITAFLRFRADQLRAYQRLVSTSLDQEIASAKAQAIPIADHISALEVNAASPAQSAKLNGLQAQLGALANQQSGALSGRESVQEQTNTAVRGSSIIDAAAPVSHSRKKPAVIDALTGLIAGLVLGMGFVAVSALASDRMRWRDDIAHALGSSVRLSVGPVRLRRLLPGRRGLAAIGKPDVQRIAGHLRGCLPGRPSALAVVPADRVDAAALAVVALALSCAEHGERVMVADLCPDVPAARLLMAAVPGVHQVEVDGTPLVVAVPERGDVVPAGPLTPVVEPARPASVDVSAAYSSTDVLLTLASLNPMLGAEHLATWASDVVVTVTAGQSTWTRVQAVGEMIRLAGTRLVSAVLIGADKTDESLGVTHMPDAGLQTKAANDGSHSAANGFLMPVDADSGPGRFDAG
jgi:capsular polysaccharide biosynthesis protein